MHFLPFTIPTKHEWDRHSSEKWMGREKTPANAKNFRRANRAGFS
jgi:hypothetical protein